MPRQRNWIPKFAVGRISGSTLTVGNDGNGFYIAVEWFGWTVMLDMLRTMRRG